VIEKNNLIGAFATKLVLCCFLCLLQN